MSVMTTTRFPVLRVLVQFFIAAIFVWTTLNQAIAGGASGKPNFLIFLADDMGFSDLGCYGGEISTPNLDSLAAGGIRYTQFYNTARCWSTRAALLTGYYAQQVGFDVLPDLPTSRIRQRPAWAHLLSEYLRAAGYRNYHSGKWHLDSSPLKCGFDRSYALLDYDHNFSPKHHTLDDQPLPPVKLGEGYYSATYIANRAIEFLKQHQEQHADQPFFEYVAFTVPHFPLQAPPEEIARYKGRYDVGWDTIRRERWKRIEEKLHLPGRLSPLEPNTGTPYRSEPAHKLLDGYETWNETPWNELPADKRTWQARKMEVHAAMVSCMDRQIGRVLDQLHAMRADENTVVFFFSDNGASAEIAMRGDMHDFSAPQGSAATFLSLGPGWSNAANTPFRRHKIWVHEGGIATPLIVRWPAQIKSGGELRHAVGHVIDVAPTILKLAGGAWPRNAAGQRVPPHPGHDLGPTFSNDVSVDRDCLWWLHEKNRAIRQGDWKLVAARDENWELYNLAKDRSETNNLIKQYPDKAAELSHLWEANLTEFQQLARQDAPNKPKPKKKKADTKKQSAPP
jgi:arylsulfatase